MIELKVKRLHPDAVMPMKATPDAACFDLVAVGEPKDHPTDPDAVVYGTGLAVEIPPGWVMLIYSRSGHGFKDGLRLSNCVGVIDSDYRGEVFVSLRGDGITGSEGAMGRTGHRIAQFMLQPVPEVQIMVAGELSDTKRGAAGFGSTGA